MFSPLIARKTLHLFTIYDSDKSGYIEKADFDRMARRYIGHGGYTEGSGEARRLMDLFDSRWAATSQLCDLDGDGHITVGEWFTARERLYDQVSKSTDQKSAFGDVIFAALDRDRKGRLSHEGFLGHLKVVDIDPGASAPMVLRLVFGDKEFLSADDMGRLGIEFAVGDDPTAAGNWLWGLF